MPKLWKTSCLTPLPPAALNDYRPVWQPSLDVLQFAYLPQVGGDDATHSTALSLSLSPGQTWQHCEDNIFCPLQWFYTIKTQVDSSTSSRVTDLLTARPQFVQLRGCESEQVICTTGHCPLHPVQLSTLVSVRTAKYYMYCRSNRTSPTESVTAC